MREDGQRTTDPHKAGKRRLSFQKTRHGLAAEEDVEPSKFASVHHLDCKAIRRRCRGDLRLALQKFKFAHRHHSFRQSYSSAPTASTVGSSFHDVHG